uniref:Coiled-coil domain containing 125 n=1 Tax=Hypotaenidia okinawae TaxID=2861861 RepID=A0A6G1RM19_9GRUI
MEEAEEDDMTCGDLGNGLGRRPGGVYEGGSLQNCSFRSRKGSGKICSSLIQQGEWKKEMMQLFLAQKETVSTMDYLKSLLLVPHNKIAMKLTLKYQMKT